MAARNFYTKRQTLANVVREGCGSKELLNQEADIGQCSEGGLWQQGTFKPRGRHWKGWKGNIQQTHNSS